MDLVCSRIQWIANIFNVFNNFSLFWTVQFLEISPLIRFVPFLSGLISCSKFCLKVLPQNDWTSSTTFGWSTSRIFKDIYHKKSQAKVVKYVKRWTREKIGKINYCAQWWTLGSRFRSSYKRAISDKFEQVWTSLDKIFIFSIIYKGPGQKRKIDKMHYCAQWWTHHHWWWWCTSR